MAVSIGEPAAVGHRVAGVDGEVDQHLLDLAGVGLDRPQVGRDASLQLDVLAERAAQQLLELGDDVVEVEHLRLHDFAAAEDQQLAGQRGRALARRGGSPRRPPRPSASSPADARRRRTRRSCRMTREEVVEVVGDAAGELAEALQAP